MRIEKEVDRYAGSAVEKEERKKLRRDRVSRQLAAQQPGRKLGPSSDGAKQVSRGDQQVAESLAHLDKKKALGIDTVTAVRVAADDRETQRRMADEQARQVRLQRLQAEAVKSGKANAVVEMRWAELLEQNMPQELHREIEDQKKACAEIIHSKDALIVDFQVHLKAKDEEYVKALKQQSEDVIELLRRMRTEFREIQGEYEVEIDAIEDAFLNERDEMLRRNSAEIDGLFEKRREMELAFMEAKQQRQEQSQREIEDLLNRDGEEYTKLKVKLETDIQTLEQQLEEMRATYQLNTEKLEYNYRVLTERDMENGVTLAIQKRKFNKLKDALSALVQRYQETDARDRRKNDELTDEYRRITKQYKDLQSKYRHFEIANHDRYKQVWSLHRESALELVERALKADEIIQRQQLGWEWQGPDLNLLRGFDMGGIPPPASTTMIQAPSSATIDNNSTSFDNETESETGEDTAPQRVSGGRVKAVLHLLAQEADFLVDASVRDALDSMGVEEGRLAAAESALRSLGVESENDVEALMAYFFNPDSRDVDYDEPQPNADFSSLGLDPAKEPEALRLLLTIIRPDDVCRAIQSFVEDRKEARILDQVRTKALSLDDDGGGGGGTAANVGAGDAGKTQRQREKLIRQREKAYWDTLSGVVTKQVTRSWDQLEKGLVRYNNMLLERTRRIQSVEQLQGQNAKLKELLRQYLAAPINDDLIVKPADTIIRPA